MKKLSQHLKQALSALAAADAGEMRTRRQMSRVLHGTPANTAANTPTNSASHRRLVALWVSTTVSKPALDYALSTCDRLDASLAILHAAGTDTVHLRRRLGHNDVRFVALRGRPETALRQYLGASARVDFLVLDGDNPASHGLAQRAGNLGVPMVLVTGTPRDTPISLAAGPLTAAA